jgi:hypothetical protein
VFDRRRDDGTAFVVPDRLAVLVVSDDVGELLQ